MNGSGFGSYNWTPPSGTGNTVVSTVYMTGGQDAGTYYDNGTLAVRVSGATASVDWIEGQREFVADVTGPPKNRRT